MLNCTIKDVCKFSVFIVSLLHLFYCSPLVSLSSSLCSFLSACWCQQSRHHVKGPLFLTLWAWLPCCSLKTRLFLEANKQLFSHCLSLSLSLSHPAESRTGGSLLECTISPLPGPPSRPEVTEAWPPATGLIVEILRLVHAQSNKVESLFTVVYNYPTAGRMLVRPSWLWVSKTKPRIL